MEEIFFLCLLPPASSDNPDGAGKEESSAVWLPHAACRNWRASQCAVGGMYVFFLPITVPQVSSGGSLVCSVHTMPYPEIRAKARGSERSLQRLTDAKPAVAMAVLLTLEG